MAVPPYVEFCRPILTYLASRPEGASPAALHDDAAVALGLSPSDLAERFESTGQRVSMNRLGWAVSIMKRAGWLEHPGRKLWLISSSGRARLADSTPITTTELRRWRRASTADSVSAPASADEAEETPGERLERAHREIVEAVEFDLRARLSSVDPAFFEKAVLRLLHAMGYVGAHGRIEHAGRTGDGGIDGVVYADRLQLDRVYVQAKRWASNVSASVVRDFAGAMDAESATKGVILTTSAFTRDAVAYVERSPKQIRLVDGQELAALMVEFGVGVSREEKVVIPRLDLDFFEEA